MGRRKALEGVSQRMEVVAELEADRRSDEGTRLLLISMFGEDAFDDVQVPGKNRTGLSQWSPAKSG